MHPFGFEYRLHFPWQYRRFFHDKEVFRLTECVIFRIKNDLSHFRLGITLKARGSSLERNRTKRQIRESMRTLGAELGSYDYNVVVPNHKKMGFPYPQKLGRCIREELPRALTRR